MNQRFRGFYPVVIDVETAGFNDQTDALLEIAAVTLKVDQNGWLVPDQSIAFEIEPFEGANIEESSLQFTGIDPFNPFRDAVSEQKALNDIFQLVRKGIKNTHCNRAIVVAHNAHFDHGFLKAAVERCEIKRDPFHPFSSFDTASLSGLAFGQTVLAKACKSAAIEFDNHEAHSALYDTQKTAELFCAIVNKWKSMGGWPPVDTSPKAGNDECDH
ncbi:ribonuclease T [Gynuella sp.]|uniref:ribonuclease T n=1 Tax=Gynuella sp. TaxID=2969146 RepID=UPI003D116173